MASRSSIKASAKKTEVSIQQYLWPGSVFAGNAKRPALENEDLRGQDYNDLWWWGEAKENSNATILRKGGVLKTLRKAFQQVETAIERDVVVWKDYTKKPPLPFAVLKTKGMHGIGNSLVMFIYHGMEVIITLEAFRDNIIQWNLNANNASTE